jgi:hypothetical protein
VEILDPRRTAHLSDVPTFKCGRARSDPAPLISPPQGHVAAAPMLWVTRSGPHTAAAICLRSNAD